MSIYILNKFPLTFWQSATITVCNMVQAKNGLQKMFQWKTFLFNILCKILTNTNNKSAVKYIFSRKCIYFSTFFKLFHISTTLCIYSSGYWLCTLKSWGSSTFESSPYDRSYDHFKLWLQILHALSLSMWNAVEKMQSF